MTMKPTCQTCTYHVPIIYNYTQIYVTVEFHRYPSQLAFQAAFFEREQGVNRGAQ
jgi:hypothetical protein